MISEIIRKFRDKAIRDTGIKPEYVYLGSQVYKSLKKECEEYLKPNPKRDIKPVVPESLEPPPPPERFMGMLIEERKDWPPGTVILTNAPVPECFEPQESINTIITPKKGRTVH